MNRRMVIPGALTILALCFAIIAMPAGAAAPALLQQTTATPDVCNPKPDLPGTVNQTAPVTDEAVTPANTLILVNATDVVSVVGKTANGFWLLVQTNDGIVGWIQGKYLNKLDAKGAAKLPIVDGTIAVTQAAPTEEATDEATEAASAPTCPTVTGIIVTNGTLALKERPISSAKDMDATVKNTERVTILAYNGSGSWYKIQTTDGSEGWVGFANVTVVGAKPDIPHDYTFVEMTVTPSGQ